MILFLFNPNKKKRKRSHIISHICTPNIHNFSQQKYFLKILYHNSFPPTNPSPNLSLSSARCASSSVSASGHTCRNFALAHQNAPPAPEHSVHTHARSAVLLNPSLRGAYLLPRSSAGKWPRRRSDGQWRCGHGSGGFSLQCNRHKKSGGGVTEGIRSRRERGGGLGR